MARFRTKVRFIEQKLDFLGVRINSSGIRSFLLGLHYADTTLNIAKYKKICVRKEAEARFPYLLLNPDTED